MDSAEPRPGSPNTPLHPPPSPPLSPTSSSIPVTFPPGPLGITFSWNKTYSRFQINSFTSSPPSKLYPGLILTKIKTSEVYGNYDEAVKALSSSSEEERTLVFMNSRNLDITKSPQRLSGPPILKKSPTSPGEEKKDNSSPPSSPPLLINSVSRPQTGQTTNRTNKSRKSNASSDMSGK
ncbi:hypothetical protein TrLO_g6554 [Triparma laevis f. longispina]|uniref:Uncharacterized protein n=1 Tax=Triparma laevis f. longispina TaxID=1714387 RepID=A0A9W7FCJ4_9STRA|nr:hypothetical protein TrLO_g6554 [Triparma laevis f. longispina]